MEILMTIIKFAAITVTVLTTMYFAYCAGNVLSVALPAMYRFMNRKPFNCRPCLTFWLTWMLIGVNALACSSLWLFAAGFFISLLVFWLVKVWDSKAVTE